MASQACPDWKWDWEAWARLFPPITAAAVLQEETLPLSCRVKWTPHPLEWISPLLLPCHPINRLHPPVPWLHWWHPQREEGKQQLIFSLLPGGPDCDKKKKNTHKQQHSYSDMYNREPAWQFPATAPPSKTRATVESQMPTQPNKHVLRRSVCNCFSRSSWVRKIPWRGERLPTPVFLPGEFHGQSSLAGTVHGVTKNWTQLRDSPFQYSCLENPMDGGACWAIVHGVAKSWTRLSMHAVVLYKSF